MATAPERSEFQLSDQAYGELLRAIARCELAPGAWLNEREASARLGMSRTPFRQALHRLALEGLIQAVPRRGYRVSRLDIHDIQENLEVRYALETTAIRRVLEEELTVDFEALEELLSAMRRALKENDAAAFMEADEEFHLTIASAAGNGRAIEAMKKAWVHVNRARYLDPPTRSGMRESVQQHSKILENLRRGDDAAVISAVTAHVSSAGAMFRDLMRRVPAAFVTPEEPNGTAPSEAAPTKATKASGAKATKASGAKTAEKPRARGSRRKAGTPA